MEMIGRKYGRTFACMLMAACVLAAGAALSTPAMAQTICNSQLVIGFPNGDNLNRVVGQTVRMSLTVTNGPSQNAGAPDNQTFTLVDFFPSCLGVVGGVCTVDPGATAGPPPPIQFAGNLSTATCPSLPLVNATDPFDIKFSFAPPFTFANGAGCTFSFDVLVVEAGSDGTPTNVSQLAVSNGICASTLTSSASGTAAITLTCPVCNDGNACNGVETCDAATAQCVPGTPLTCNDANQCTDDSCNTVTGCVFTPKPPDFCNDSNFCTIDACVPATGCTHTAQPPDFCNDSNACTDDACVPATGCTHTAKPPDFCNDSNACTDDACVPATGCTNIPKPPDFCDDNNVCTSDVCDPQQGCVNTPLEPQPPECTSAICRTPGFWGTHAGTEKSSSVNIAEAVIDCADGVCTNHTANDFLLICGEKIDSPDSNPADGNTDYNDAASSTEAMCVPVLGNQILQLARQLTAAALNCIVSGGGADCSGTALYTTVFSTCNTKCASGSATKAEMTACISELDCLNNGGTFNGGICTPGAPGNCHEQPLVNEELGLDFDPPGPAGSSMTCKVATATKCTVVGPTEALCSTDSLP